MPKLLRGQDKLLLALSLIGDLVETAVSGGSNARKYGKLGIYYPPGYKSYQLTNIVNKSLTTGNIKKTVKANGQVVLELTSQGKNKLTRAFPMTKFQKKWDKHWRLVVFDIPEQQRTKRILLRRKLIKLNFAQLQKSIYISPHNIIDDLIEFLDAKQLTKGVLVFETKHQYLPEPKIMAKTLWPIKDLFENYQQILDQLNQNKKFTYQELTQLTNQYLFLVHQDPFLPFELLPKNWPQPTIQKTLIQCTDRHIE